MSTPEAVAASIQATLNVRANDKRQKRTRRLPFVLSARGVFLEETEKALSEWRKYIPLSEMGYMLNRIACVLLIGV